MLLVQASDKFWKNDLCIRIVCHITFIYLHIVCHIFLLLCVLILRTLEWTDVDVPKTSLWAATTNGDAASQDFEEDLAGIED